MSFHAVVIGSGVDALVAAHVLARGGTQVLGVEERPPAAQDFGWVPSQVVGELGLKLAVQAPDPWASALLPEGGTLDLFRDLQRTADSIRKLSPRDAEAWPSFCRRMAVLARLFEQLYLETPTDPLNLRLALRVRGLGREGMVDLMRLLPMPVAELLDEWFECDALKGALGAMGILNIQQGPRSAGTAFRFLHHHVGSPEGVFRPPRTDLSAHLRQRPGVHFRASRVEKILVKSGRASGVVLDGGEEIDARVVVSGADPRRTLLELADPAWLDPELARSIGNIRSRGVSARLSFNGSVSAGNLVCAPSLDYLERAYDEVKYGRVSRAPYLEAYSSSQGTEVHFQYVPHGPKGALREALREALRADLGAAVRRLLPGLENAQVASILGPADLEREEGWPEGQPYHAELALDQALWMRPLPELAQYKTPIEGLWLCGPATHPGGGVAGAAGYNCARAILKEKGSQ